MPPHLEDLEASGKMPVFFCVECPDSSSTVFRFEYFLPIGVVLQTAPLGVTKVDLGGGMDDTAGTLPTCEVKSFLL